MKALLVAAGLAMGVVPIAANAHWTRSCHWSSWRHEEVCSRQWVRGDGYHRDYGSYHHRYYPDRYYGYNYYR